jgi:two-component system phosphoglycerate transport system response regulator PgtA
MLVDNDRHVLSTMMRISMRDGATTIPCKSLEDVKSYVHAGIIPDVVVTDIVLEDETGIAVHDFMLAHCPHVPVVFVSGYSNVRVPIDRKVLQKPFAIDEFLKTIDDAMAEATRSLALGSGRTLKSKSQSLKDPHG